MEDKLDILVETVEVLTTDINKVNFELEGLREDFEDMETNRPFLVRQMNLNENKSIRFMRRLQILMHEKEHADAELGAARLAMAADAKDKKEKLNKKAKRKVK